MLPDSTYYPILQFLINLQLTLIKTQEPSRLPARPLYALLCLVAQSCPTLWDPMDCKPSRLLCPWGFSSQEYWSGLPCPPPGDLPNPGIEPKPCAQQVDSLLCELHRKPIQTLNVIQISTCLQPCSYEKLGLSLSSHEGNLIVSANYKGNTSAVVIRTLAWNAILTNETLKRSQESLFGKNFSLSYKKIYAILDAWGWCIGTTQRDGVGREEGGGFRMGNTCMPVADSF